MHTAARLPRALRASVTPMVVVVLPSPAGVGVMAVTRISFPGLRSFTSRAKSRDTLALCLPYCSRWSSGIPSFPAICAMGSMRAARAMSMSEGTVWTMEVSWGWGAFEGVPKAWDRGSGDGTRMNDVKIFSLENKNFSV